MKKALILVVLLLLIFIAGIMILETDTKKEKPYIAVTSFTLYELTNRLIGQHVEVKKLIPFGAEMHSYMPTPKTMSLISKAELFIFNGFGMEPWIKKEYKNQMDMSKFITPIGAKEDEHHHHNEVDADPHYWLDLDNMILMSHALSTKLSENFPQYEKDIQMSERAIIAELQELNSEYKKRLQTCKRREIVLNHNAFGYLANRYDFSSHCVTGLSADEEVSAKKMKEISDLVKSEGIKIVFFESFVSPKISETIAQETGAKILSLHTLANTTEDEARKGYTLLMKENLEKLSLAMECE